MTALSGDAVTLAVTFEGSPGILGATLTVSYGEGLTLAGAKPGGALSALTMTGPGALSSPCTFTWDGIDIGEGDVRGGEVLLLTFRVAADAEAGSELAVSVSGGRGALVGRDLGALGVAYEAGGVSVVDYAPGDVDGDGLVDLRDVVCVRRHIAGGYDQDINVAAADVDDSLEVDLLDVLLIRRHVAGGWGVTLRRSRLRRDGAPGEAATAGPPSVPALAARRLTPAA